MFPNRLQHSHVHSEFPHWDVSLLTNYRHPGKVRWECLKGCNCCISCLVLRKHYWKTHRTACSCNAHCALLWIKMVYVISFASNKHQNNPWNYFSKCDLFLFLLHLTFLPLPVHAPSSVPWVERCQCAITDRKKGDFFTFSKIWHTYFKIYKKESYISRKRRWHTALQRTKYYPL